MIPINSHKCLHPENDHMMDTRQQPAFVFELEQKSFIVRKEGGPGWAESPGNRTVRVSCLCPLTAARGVDFRLRVPHRPDCRRDASELNFPVSLRRFLGELRGRPTADRWRRQMWAIVTPPRRSNAAGLYHPRCPAWFRRNLSAQESEDHQIANILELPENSRACGESM